MAEESRGVAQQCGLGNRWMRSTNERGSNVSKIWLSAEFRGINKPGRLKLTAAKR